MFAEGSMCQVVQLCEHLCSMYADCNSKNLYTFLTKTIVSELLCCYAIPSLLLCCTELRTVLNSGGHEVDFTILLAAVQKMQCCDVRVYHTLSIAKQIIASGGEENCGCACNEYWLSNEMQHRDMLQLVYQCRTTDEANSLLGSSD